MMDVIAKALNEQRRALHRTFVPQPPGAAEIKARTPMFGAEQIDQMLRIEIERDHESDLYRYLLGTGQLLHGDFYDHEGPRQFQGVDVYFVDRLPAPGWRIVNPMAQR